MSRISHIACFYGHGGHGKEQLHIGLLLPACDSSFDLSLSESLHCFFFPVKQYKSLSQHSPSKLSNPHQVISDHFNTITVIKTIIALLQLS